VKRIQSQTDFERNSSIEDRTPWPYHNLQ